MTIRSGSGMTPDCRPARLQALIREFQHKRILIVGDLMLDEFIWGKVTRISPEAPVPVVNVASESYYPGGAANVARNVREFTPETMVMGRTGTDTYGRQLTKLLAESGIDTRGVLQDSSTSTTVKSRIIARNQQVVRVDRECTSALTAEQAALSLSWLEKMGPVDAVIVADYGKGVLTQFFADGITEFCRRNERILTIDPHPHSKLNWQGATAIKPNRLEAFLAAGMPVSDAVLPVLSDKPLLEAGRRLMERWQARELLITLGEHGMLLCRAGLAPHHTPTCAKSVFDVSGAGDTAIAIYTLALAAGAHSIEAAHLANHASGVVVGKLGTAAVTFAELMNDVGEG